MEATRLNTIYWRDLVRVNGVVREFIAPVALNETDKVKDLAGTIYLGDTLDEIDENVSKFYDPEEPLYDCEPYMDAVAKKYGINRSIDDIETHMFGDIDDEEASGFDIAPLGGYINNMQY